MWAGSGASKVNWELGLDDVCSHGDWFNSGPLPGSAVYAFELLRNEGGGITALTRHMTKEFSRLGKKKKKKRHWQCRSGKR